MKPLLDLHFPKSWIQHCLQTCMCTACGILCLCKWLAILSLPKSFNGRQLDKDNCYIVSGTLFHLNPPLFPHPSCIQCMWRCLHSSLCLWGWYVHAYIEVNVGVRNVSIQSVSISISMLEFQWCQHQNKWCASEALCNTEIECFSCFWHLYIQSFTHCTRSLQRKRQQ